MDTASRENGYKRSWDRYDCLLMLMRGSFSFEVFFFSNLFKKKRENVCLGLKIKEMICLISLSGFFFLFENDASLSHRKCLVENVLNNSYGCKHVMFWN